MYYFQEGKIFTGPYNAEGSNDSFHKWFERTFDKLYPTQYFLNEILEEYLDYAKKFHGDESGIATSIHMLVNEIPSELAADKEYWILSEKAKELAKKVVQETSAIRARKLTDEELKDWERRQELEEKKVDETKFSKYRGSDFDVRF